MRLRTIRASEIGTFLYCRRAWWYQLQGVESRNKGELAGGTSFHNRHGRQVLISGLLRTGAVLLLLAGIVLAGVGVTLWLVR
jgi:hypothetical protein